MPDATITSTASTFGTISGVFSADQSTISGTISGIVPGTLTGSVGVPGPAGPAGIGLPAGGTSGQFLQKTSGVDYATDWVTVNLTGLATESWVTAGFYPLTGNPSAFLQAAALTPYLTSATAASTYQTLSGMSSYLTTATAASTYQTLTGMSDYLAKAGNLAGLASTSTARTNLGLGSLAVVNDAPSDGSQYARKNGAWDVVSAAASYISSVSSPLSVTSGNLTIDLSAYAPLASPVFTGDARAVTPAFGDNDTSISTTAFVQSALLGGTAVARNLEVEVRNQSGSTIPAGSIVYISGATGNKPLITLAQANNDTNSAQTIGFVKTAIANNGTGYVIVRGELENIDTSALTEGVQLYLSPTVAGTWTTTKPSAPLHLVYVGVVIRSHPTLGTILVAVQNGYELNELHDVAIGTLVNNDLLAYESSTDLWKNKTYSALGLLTSSAAASTYAPIASPTFTGNVSLGSGVTSFTLNPTNTITIPVGLSATESTLLENRGLLVRDSSNIPVARFQAQEVLIPSVGITFSDLSVQTSAGISSATAASTYQTIAGMSSYAPKASPALTGNVTITSNSAGAALFIEQSGAGNILTLHDQASDTNFVAIDQNGKVSTIPSDATAGAGFNIAHGTAPTSPVNGDIWTTTGGLFMRQNGSTQQYVDFGGTQTISGAKTFSNANQTLGNSTAAGTIAIGTGATVSGSSRTINIGTASATGSTNNINIGGGSGTTNVTLGGSINLNGPIAAPINNISLGTGTAVSVYAFGTGATVSGSTKAVSIGTGALAGATTTIAIGSTTGTSTTTLQGTTNGVTAAADTNSVALATTAYVVGQAGSATPIVNGTAAVGTSLRYARQDHVHGTDTTRAALAGATFSGLVSTPASTTGSAGFRIVPGVAPSTPTNGDVWATTTDLQVRLNGVTETIAEQSWVTAQGYITSAALSSYAPLASPTFTGTVTIPAGASISGFAPLASPAFTGTPSLPTGTTAVTQTAGNNTTAVATTAFVLANAGSTSFATDAQVITGTSTTTALAPGNAGFLKADPRLRQLGACNATSISGSGAVTAASGQQFAREMYLGSLAAGRAAFSYGILGITAGMVTSKANRNQIDFSKKVWVSGSCSPGITSSGTSYVGDSNTMVRISLGGYAAYATGNMTQKGIGWKKVGGAASVIQLTVHNGTTLTDVATSTSVAVDAAIDWLIYSDGTGNVTLYINGTQAATTSAGPTGTTTSACNNYYEQVEAVSTPAVRHAMHANSGWIYFAD
jgi:hypothetical protein